MSVFYSDSLSCYLIPIFFFCSMLPSRIARYIQLSRLLRLLTAVATSQTVLVFNDLRGLRSTARPYCRMPLCWDLPDFFS